MNDDSYDEGEHCKAVYAHFGRAYYFSNVFEVGLGNAFMTLGFLAEAKDKAHVAKCEGRPFDRAQHEADFDAYVARQNAQTLGNLIKTASRFEPLLGPEFQALLPEVKEKRDFLAHHFFRERAVELFSRRGRDSMIAELEEMQQIFHEADETLSEIMEPHVRAVGLTDEILARMMDKMRREVDES